jgi:hypothetical protein
MIDQPSYKRVAKRAILRFQKTFGLLPREVCLVSGAPRSGTTALAEWLGLHQDVAAFFESRILIGVHRFVEEIYRFRSLEQDRAMLISLARQLVLEYYFFNSEIRRRKSLLLDKEPLEPIAFPSREYERFIVNVRRLFPESKLLLAIRDPVATIWSMRGRTWGTSLMNAEARRLTIEEHIENWCSCANLILLYCSDPNTYVVQFWRLVNDPENESRRIYDFLNLREGISFRPRQTSEIGFSDEERETILRKVRPQLELLKAQGISDLS